MIIVLSEWSAVYINECHDYSFFYFEFTVTLKRFKLHRETKCC